MDVSWQLLLTMCQINLSQHPPRGAHSHAIQISEHDNVGSADGWENVPPNDEATGLDAYSIGDPMVEGASGHGGEIDDVSSIGTHEDPELIGLKSAWNVIARDDI